MRRVNAACAAFWHSARRPNNTKTPIHMSAAENDTTAPARNDRSSRSRPTSCSSRHSRGDGHAVVDPLGAVDLHQDDRGAGAARAARERARRGRRGKRAGRAAAEARRHRQRDPAAHARRPRRRRDRRLGGERGAGDPARATRRRAQATACCSIRSTAPRTSTCAAASARSSASCATIAARGDRAGFAAPAGRAAGRGGLRAVRLVHGVRADDGPRRRHVRARSGDRRVHAGASRAADAGGAQELLGERRQPPHVPGRLSDVSRLGAGATATPAATSARWWPTCTASC